MTAAPATVPDISPDFVAGLAERAQEAKGLHRLPGATVDDFVASGLADLLVPLRYGGIQAPVAGDSRPGPPDGPWPRVERMDAGLLHPAHWVMALFGEEAGGGLRDAPVSGPRAPFACRRRGAAPTSLTTRCSGLNATSMCWPAT
jgi:hypothetical protein